MSKKAIIGVVVAILLLGGGYALFRYIQTQQEQQAYQASATKVGDDFVNYLKAQNAKDAYNNLFSDSLKAAYAQSYWEGQFFPQFKTMTAPSLSTTSQVTGDATHPAPYPQGIEARKLVYQFKVHDTTYNLALTIIKKANSSWKIDSISGDYKAAS